MGRHTYSAVCSNVVRPTYTKNPNDYPDWTDDRILHGWRQVAEAAEVGNKSKLYACIFVKAVEKKIYAVCLVNEHPYSNVGGFSPVVFSGPIDKLGWEIDEDYDEYEWEKSPEGRSVFRALSTGVNMATGLASIKLFVSNFGIKDKIISTDSVNQTI